MGSLYYMVMYTENDPLTRIESRCPAWIFWQIQRFFIKCRFSFLIFMIIGIIQSFTKPGTVQCCHCFQINETESEFVLWRRQFWLTVRRWYCRINRWVWISTEIQTEIKSQVIFDQKWPVWGHLRSFEAIWNHLSQITVTVLKVTARDNSKIMNSEAIFWLISEWWSIFVLAYIIVYARIKIINPL